MRANRVILFLLVTALLSTPLWAQENQDEEQENRGQPTIEELYLSQDIELQILRSQALAPDRESKLLALQSIRNMVENDTVSPQDSGAFTILRALAAEGTFRQVRSNGRVMNDFPEIRREATALIAEIGGETAHDVLIRIAREDDEPMVLAEAVYGLGTIGMNDNNEASAQVVRILQVENSAETPDNNLAFASILALERLASASEPPIDPEIVSVLLETASAPYIRTVRRRAVEAIVNIREQQAQ
ncbi:MAG: HEAT repeat domain-containing protein [Alkalispirochaetaceae bacterium]